MGTMVSGSVRQERAGHVLVQRSGTLLRVRCAVAPCHKSTCKLRVRSGVAPCHKSTMVFFNAPGSLRVVHSHLDVIRRHAVHIVD
jgi:hypothetical protein